MLTGFFLYENRYYFNYVLLFLSQGAMERFDDIVFACGSGGTADGLALANYLTSHKLG